MDWFSLSNLARLQKAVTRSISAENPDGSKSGGARAEPEDNLAATDLGKGWKARPCIDLPAGEVTTLAEITGSGTIQHIWITVDSKAYRDCVLRCYWDDEKSPSVEVPLGDFFANGHGMRYNVNSLVVAVNPSGGFNCYWPMPFHRNAKITIENQSDEVIRHFFYQITYALHEHQPDIALFHAQWRRSLTSREHPEHTLLDQVRGQGHYVGTFIAWTQMSEGWWGEGEIKFFVDGDREYPTICGTGTEDYFGGAWCFGEGETYNTPFLGYPLCYKQAGGVPKHGLYRWHLPDPIRFEKDLQVTIQALGWWPNRKYQPLTDDIASVAYWYQSEPHSNFPAFPVRHERFSR